MGNFCFCGKEKREDRLTCPRCFELYRKQTKAKIDLIKWVKVRALERLDDLGASKENPKTDLERALEEKKENLRVLEDILPEEVGLVLKERLTGAGRLRQEEIKKFREDIEKELWKEKGGNKLYAEVKNLQEEVRANVLPIREVLRQVEKMERELSSVDQILKSVFPNNKNL